MSLLSILSSGGRPQCPSSFSSVHLLNQSSQSTSRGVQSFLGLVTVRKHPESFETPILQCRHGWCSRYSVLPYLGQPLDTKFTSSDSYYSQLNFTKSTGGSRGALQWWTVLESIDYARRPLEWHSLVHFPWRDGAKAIGGFC